MNDVNGTIFAYFVFVISLLLLVSLLSLIVMICKHFGNLLMDEIRWLCFVQILFQIGFLARAIGTYLGISIFYENGNMWDFSYCMLATLMPLCYEAIPILVLYAQHIKHFKARSSYLREGAEGNEEAAELIFQQQVRIT